MRVRLLYDARDQAIGERRGDRRLYWLDDLGAVPQSEAQPAEAAYLFAGARSEDDYAALVRDLPLVRDRPAERAPLLRLDATLDALEWAGVETTGPRTWRLELDAPLPTDLRYPLFLRAPQSSWKLGGATGRVDDERGLRDECVALRRAFGWDTPLLARSWLLLQSAGESSHGPVPQEVRVWLIDQRPRAWSFHHLHVVPRPAGFPPAEADLRELARQASAIGAAFTARLIVADFARATDGRWRFIEAGPGSCAGTAHEAVFKHVAAALAGDELPLHADLVGGPLAL